MTTTIPHGIRAALLERTRPSDDRSPLDDGVDLGLEPRREAVAASTTTLTDLLASHLQTDEQIRDIWSRFAYKNKQKGFLGVTVLVHLDLLVLTDRRVLHVWENQIDGVTPRVDEYAYGSLTVEGKRLLGRMWSVVSEPGGVKVVTGKKNVEWVTQRLTSPPAAADWITEAIAAPDASTRISAEAPAAAWHPDPMGRHEYRWWDGVSWTAQVADAGVTSSDPIPQA